MAHFGGIEGVSREGEVGRGYDGPEPERFGENYLEFSDEKQGPVPRMTYNPFIDLPMRSNEENEGHYG